MIFKSAEIMPKHIVVAMQLSSNTEIHRTTKAPLCSISHPPLCPRRAIIIYILVWIFWCAFIGLHVFFLLFLFFVNGTMS